VSRKGRTGDGVDEMLNDGCAAELVVAVAILADVTEFAGENMRRARYVTVTCVKSRRRKGGRNAVK
jgi:hypothetical protein